MKADKIIDAVQGVTKKWAAQRKREEKQSSTASHRHHYLAPRSYRVTIKDAAWQVMEDAYMKASAGGKLPAHARQIMYAARGYIQQKTGEQLNDQYFTQNILPEYLTSTRVDWNVVFDARGHFYEPHTDHEVPLGTLDVRRYVTGIGKHNVDALSFDIWERHFPTLGPRNRYSAILFIEKEGFMPLFDAVQLRERFDIAIMSTKGMSVTASRELVDAICYRHDVPLLVLHDFDKAGFSIAGTLRRDTRRYSFRNSIQVIDLGLRIGDIDGLESEDVVLKGSPYKNRSNLQENGATKDEIEYLVGRSRRVELNAFTSDQLISFIEKKLNEQGIKKLVPSDETLTSAYRRASEQVAIQKMIDDAMEDFRANLDEVAIPDDLRARIERELKEQPARSWDAVLRDIAGRHDRR